MAAKLRPQQEHAVEEKHRIRRRFLEWSVDRCVGSEIEEGSPTEARPARAQRLQKSLHQPCVVGGVAEVAPRGLGSTAPPNRRRIMESVDGGSNDAAVDRFDGSNELIREGGLSRRVYPVDGYPEGMIPMKAGDSRSEFSEQLTSSHPTPPNGSGAVLQTRPPRRSAAGGRRAASNRRVVAEPIASSLDGQARLSARSPGSEDAAQNGSEFRAVKLGVDIVLLAEQVLAFLARVGVVPFRRGTVDAVSRYAEVVDELRSDVAADVLTRGGTTADPARKRHAQQECLHAILCPQPFVLCIHNGPLGDTQLATGTSRPFGFKLSIPLLRSMTSIIPERPRGLKGEVARVARARWPAARRTVRVSGRTPPFLGPNGTADRGLRKTPTGRAAACAA